MPTAQPASTSGSITYSVPGRTRYIHRIGIELEGGWRLSRRITPYMDGSVRNVTVPAEGVPVYPDEPRNGPGECDCGQCEVNRGNLVADTALRRANSGSGQGVVGEIASPPLKIGEAIEWLLGNYPDAANATCGMHVHTSFRTRLRYSQLMDRAFFDHWRRHYGQWAHLNIPRTDGFWPRWNGGNRFCMPTWEPDMQAQHRVKAEGRYAAINCCYNVRQEGRRQGVGDKPRGTIECRVFPVFTDKHMAAAAICAHVKVIEDYLESQPWRERVAIAAEAPLDPAMLFEEVDERSPIQCV